MADQVDKGKRGSRVVKFMPLIMLASVLVYAAAAYLLLFMPKLGKFMEGGEYDVRPLEARVESDGNYLKEVEAAIADYAAINVDHKQKLNLMLPSDEDVPGLFVQLDEIARKNGLVLSTVDTIIDEKDPGPMNSKKVRVSANFIGGSYEQFLLVLNDIERLVRIADVQSIAFSSGGGSYSVTMTTYFVDETVSAERTVEEVPAQLSDVNAQI